MKKAEVFIKAQLKVIKNHDIKRNQILCGEWSHTPLLGNPAASPYSWSMAPHATQSFGFLVLPAGPTCQPSPTVFWVDWRKKEDYEQVAVYMSTLYTTDCCQ